MKDVISLGVGEPDYSAPDKVIDACIDSLKRKETSYTSNWGLLELRQEIANFSRTATMWTMTRWMKSWSP